VVLTVNWCTETVTIVIIVVVCIIVIIIVVAVVIITWICIRWENKLILNILINLNYVIHQSSLWLKLELKLLEIDYQKLYFNKLLKTFLFTCQISTPLRFYCAAWCYQSEGSNSHFLENNVSLSEFCFDWNGRELSGNFAVCQGILLLLMKHGLHL